MVKIHKLIKYNSDAEVIQVITFDRDPPDANNKRRGFLERLIPRIGDEVVDTTVTIFFPELTIE